MLTAVPNGELLPSTKKSKFQKPIQNWQFRHWSVEPYFGHFQMKEKKRLILDSKKIPKTVEVTLESVKPEKTHVGVYPGPNGRPFLKLML